MSFLGFFIVPFNLRFVSIIFVGWLYVVYTYCANVESTRQFSWKTGWLILCSKWSFLFPLISSFPLLLIVRAAFFVYLYAHSTFSLSLSSLSVTLPFYAALFVRCIQTKSLIFVSYSDCFPPRLKSVQSFWFFLFIYIALAYKYIEVVQFLITTQKIVINVVSPLMYLLLIDKIHHVWTDFYRLPHICTRYEFFVWCARCMSAIYVCPFICVYTATRITKTNNVPANSDFSEYIDDLHSIKTIHFFL